MLQTLLFALLPILVTIALGYFAAARHYFDDNDSRMLVRLVMNFMLPLSVFFWDLEHTAKNHHQRYSISYLAISEHHWLLPDFLSPLPVSIPYQPTYCITSGNVGC